MEDSIEIVPVTDKTIGEALSLVHRIFPHPSEEEDPDLWFKMSLEPENYSEQMRENGARDVRYFVAVDKKTNKVVGTTGLYHLNEDPPGTIWLGWYCVDPEFRRRGIGRSILQWTIDKARSEGESTLRLYTPPEEDVDAQIVYDKFGFETTGTEQKAGYSIAYKQLKLHV